VGEQNSDVAANSEFLKTVKAVLSRGRKDQRLSKYALHSSSDQVRPSLSLKKKVKNKWKRSGRKNPQTLLS